MKYRLDMVVFGVVLIVMVYYSMGVWRGPVLAWAIIYFRALLREYREYRRIQRVIERWGDTAQ